MVEDTMTTVLDGMVGCASGLRKTLALMPWWLRLYYGPGMRFSADAIERAAETVRRERST